MYNKAFQRTDQRESLISDTKRSYSQGKYKWELGPPQPLSTLQQLKRILLDTVQEKQLCLRSKMTRQPSVNSTMYFQCAHELSDTPQFKRELNSFPLTMS